MAALSYADKERQPGGFVMTLQQLTYFVNVAEKLSFSEAAKRLYVAPSAISYAITNLEKELGVSLLNRKGAVSLTKEGTYLYLEAVKILKSTENIYKTLSESRNRFPNELRVGFLPSLLKPYFSDIIVPFINAHKETNLSIHPMNLDPLMDALLNRDIDIALTRSFHVSTVHYPELKHQLFCEDHFCLLLYSSHPLARMESVSDLNMLEEESFITVNPDVSKALHERILEISAARNYQPRIRYTVSNMDNVFTQVAAHMGISIVPSFNGYYSNIPELKFVPMEGSDLRADVVFAWDKNNNKKLIADFLEHLRSYNKNKGGTHHD